MPCPSRLRVPRACGLKTVRWRISYDAQSDGEGFAGGNGTLALIIDEPSSRGRPICRRPQRATHCRSRLIHRRRQSARHCRSRLIRPLPNRRHRQKPRPSQVTAGALHQITRPRAVRAEVSEVAAHALRPAASKPGVSHVAAGARETVASPVAQQTRRHSVHFERPRPTSMLAVGAPGDRQR